MTFLEHLDELRKRITHAVGGLLVGFIIAFAFINCVFDFVYQRLVAPCRAEADLHRSARDVHAAGSRSPRYRRPDRIAVHHAAGVAVHRARACTRRKRSSRFRSCCRRRRCSSAARRSRTTSCSRPRGISSRGSATTYVEFMPRVGPVFGMYVKLMLGIGLTFQLPVLMFVLARLGIVTRRLPATKFQVRGPADLHLRRGHHARR